MSFLPNYIQIPTPVYVRAFHEAGHAIVAHELGLGIEFVIIDSGEYFLRTYNYTYNGEMVLKEFYDHVEKECVCLAGGYAANIIQFEWMRDHTEFDRATMDGTIRDIFGVESYWPSKYKEEFEKFTEQNPTIDIPTKIHQVNMNWDGAVELARVILEPRREQLKALAFKFYLSKGEIKGEEIHAWLR